MSITTHPLPQADRLRRLNALGNHLPYSLVALAARLFPAAVFWSSGRTKMDGFSLKPSAVFLFEQEYALPVIPPRSRRGWPPWPSICSRFCWFWG